MRSFAVAVLAGATLLFSPPRAGAYTLWGYEDDYGLVHLSEWRQSDEYVLVYEGPKDPKMGFAAIKKRIHDLGAVSKDRKDGWILEATRSYVRMGTAPLGPGGYPEVIESGPLLDLVRDKSRACGLDPELLYAVIEQESRFQAGAVSPKGAAGLMQLMPATQATFGVADPFDPERNVATGARFLQGLISRFGDLSLALAAYNAGPETVARCGGIPDIAETRNYVARILHRYAMLKESHPGLGAKKDLASAVGKAKGKGKKN
ncbi:MAG: lytic transglycosylase domain-containing protein [Solidesulfovibrio sp.]|uniref:lytic transglycosylase domain-containing protein n=1 Tax=Solidesulfovibrio sp. TaxID=2910990 RepID=UPI002B221367|nr:lytic transglycosylase domain-containing protein [Solidesulfovibrio sp.]MEA4855845.1 lytic transglycosylase domain-containing protein [Solidesulfovibrio sp.]